MFRGRLGIWIAVIIICVGGTFLIENVPIWLETFPVSISSEIGDTDILNKSLDNRYGKYVVKQKSSDHDIVFSRSGEERDGYTLQENMLCTPMVMYVPSYVDNYSGGFITSGEGMKQQIDLLTVLDAMEAGLSWQDIGVHEKVLSGKVKLYIPDERNWAYPEVEKLFYLTLNKGKAPTAEEKAMLQTRVDALMNSCIKVASVGAEMYQECNKTSKEHKAFIAPETLYLTSKGTRHAYGEYSAFVPVYFPKTVIVYANAYLKNDSNVANDFIKEIQEDKDFMADTGWRVRDSTYDISDVSTRIIKSVS